MFKQGDRVQLPGQDGIVTVVVSSVGSDGGLEIVVRDQQEQLVHLSIAAADIGSITRVNADGTGDPQEVLAGLWSYWMLQAAESVDGTAFGSAPLKQYLHQFEAVYGHMLPQPMLRFLLADEPGTGKTIMAGLYATEASRLGLIDRLLVICPAHLVTKWQEDFQRFFGRELRRIRATTIRERVLESSDHPFWIVSLHLAASNPQVRAAIDPDIAGWDLVIIDEAHRLTPYAQTMFQVGLDTAVKAPRALLMTATPHRGSEYLFRSLMYLTDPSVFPMPTESIDRHGDTRRLKPGSVHFLRRMKEELVDLDLVTPLFKKRTAHNLAIALNLDEKVVYDEAQRLVAEYFPKEALGLGAMVYGKRCASSLYALRETLYRRMSAAGTPTHPGETIDIDEEDRDEREMVEIAHLGSRSVQAERRELAALIARIDELLRKEDLAISKWPPLEEKVLKPNGIVPGGNEQLVVFTEYADTAEWLTERFRLHGYAAEMYSGRQSHEERERIRAAFAAGEFQVIVSTDAGNEGIDLQTARVLVNWDIPWSLVTLEQRLGRIHRVGQERDVDLYNLIATDTREGRAHEVLLENLVAAANELDGKMFDSLALVGDIAVEEGLGKGGLEEFLARLFTPGVDSGEVERAIAAITKDRLRQIHQRVRAEDSLLSSKTDVGKAIAGLNEQQLDRVNPYVVERYLTRLDESGLIKASRSPVAEAGFWNVERGRLSPLPFGNGIAALVATSGEAKLAASRELGVALAAERAVPLGPNERPFRELARQAAGILSTSLLQGAVLEDPTSLNDYTLTCFTVKLNRGRIKGGDGRWRHTSRWSYLVKTDAADSRVVPWEVLANLQPAREAEARKRHPMDLTRARDAAEARIGADAQGRRKDLEDWLRSAAVQLDKLESDLTDGIEDADERRNLRHNIRQAVELRKEELYAAVEFEVGAIEEVGWAYVHGSASVERSSADPDSELVSMQYVRNRLTAEGWIVVDVHTEKLGYDLHAYKGHRQRAIEVKGIRGSASSSGIELTGAELTKAVQMGADYWLYVVDNCHNGVGQLFAAWPDPATVFAGATKDIPILRITGSDLKAAKERGTP